MSNITEPISASSLANSIIASIDGRTATVGIIGMGYVGLPMALEFARAGFPTIGYDTDIERSAMLARGSSYVADITDSELQTCLDAGNFDVASDMSSLQDADAILICVPTPLSKSKDPDLSAVMAAGEAVARCLRRGQLVVLESTTYPGTTQEVLKPILEATGLVESDDFFLAFSPERVDPGNPEYGVANITKLVAGCTPAGTEVAAALYNQIVTSVVSVTSPGVAEAAKLLENTFRSINIGLANEMAIICRHLGIDVWEVIAAASTKPFGFMPHYPGPGIGGHCIPLDPHYLAWKARLQGYEPRLISVASQINADMPRHVVQLVTDALNDSGRSVRNSNILVLGVAYKPHVSDTRESPAIDIIEMLRHRGAKIDYCDPYVPELLINAVAHRSQPLTAARLREADCVLITTNHLDFDYSMVVQEAKLVLDTRNATRKYAADNPHLRFL